MYVGSIKSTTRNEVYGLQFCFFFSIYTTVVDMNDVSTMGMYAWCGTIVNYFIAKNKTSLTKQKN